MTSAERRGASPSIRRSFVSLVTGLILLLTCAYSLLIVLYAWIVEDNIFNRMVRDEAVFIEQHFHRTGQAAAPRPPFMQLLTDVQQLPAPVLEQYRREPMRVEYTLPDGRALHLKVLQLGARQHVLVAEVGALEVSGELSPLLLGALLLMLLVSLALVLPLALWQARRITAPMTRLAAAVQDAARPVMDSGFAQRFPDNEIGVLAAAISESQRSLQQVLDRESNFAKDVSHEIRTSLSVLNNLLSQPGAARLPDSRQLQQMRETVQSLEQTTSTLLALARAETAAQETLNLTDMLERALLEHFGLNHSAAGQALALDVRLEGEAWLHANAELCRILLHNVLDNLVRYASEPGVTLSVSQRQLRIANRFRMPLPHDPLQSGQRTGASPGIGQGLSLMRRICQVQHWQMRVEQEKGRFILTIFFDATVPSQNHDKA